MTAAERGVRRWLAARLFGTWMAYQGDGLVSTMQYLRTCYETYQREHAVDGNPLEAIRRSDLEIVHGALDPPALARRVRRTR